MALENPRSPGNHALFALQFDLVTLNDESHLIVWLDMQESPNLDGFAGRVSDSGEGRWTAIAAIEEGVPADVLTAALSARFSSRGEDEFANKLLSAMRRQFGGHAEKP